ncbi:hypothetical protein AB4179_15580 [Vibrio lentus]|uniref:hypothetical protein n=1 Tax=Vibrio TaxID=662 RepID=UPI0003181994|nr:MULTISPECIES: hypothetical protein [Vibrio]MDN3629959.1 hypothetical protein [Vibrio lentus]WGS59902.1 hypothetical protein ISX51_11490 [Vibrio lentus]
MGEKTKVPSITDTFEIDGIYYTDQHVDLNTPELEAKRALYEQINPHSNRGRNIDEEV